jgi:hypothetical protein
MIELQTLGKRTGTVSLKRIVASGFGGRPTHEDHFAIIRHSIAAPFHRSLMLRPVQALLEKSRAGRTPAQRV